MKHIAETTQFKLSVKQPNTQIEKKGDGDSTASYKPLSQTSKNDSPIKLCYRIWSAYSKYLRNKCKANIQIDSIFFGSYAKLAGEDENSITYCCIPDKSTKDFKFTGEQQTLPNLEC